MLDQIFISKLEYLDMAKCFQHCQFGIGFGYYTAYSKLTFQDIKKKMIAGRQSISEHLGNWTWLNYFKEDLLNKHGRWQKSAPGKEPTAYFLPPFILIFLYSIEEDNAMWLTPFKAVTDF